MSKEHVEEYVATYKHTGNKTLTRFLVNKLGRRPTGAEVEAARVQVLKLRKKISRRKIISRRKKRIASQGCSIGPEPVPSKSPVRPCKSTIPAVVPVLPPEPIFPVPPPEPEPTVTYDNSTAIDAAVRSLVIAFVSEDWKIRRLEHVQTFLAAMNDMEQNINEEGEWLNNEDRETLGEDQLGVAVKEEPLEYYLQEYYAPPGEEQVKSD